MPTLEIYEFRTKCLSNGLTIAITGQNAVEVPLQRSLEAAALHQRRQVTRADVQAALDAMPWLTRPAE
jgi:hypothetical protein